MIPEIKLHKKQGEAIKLLRDSKKRFILYGGAANSGKSVLGNIWLILNCFEFPDTRWFMGREELKRLRFSTLQTFFKVCSIYKIPRDSYNYNAQDHYIQFSNGSRIDLLELKYYPSDPMFQRFGSVEYTGGWIEEAGEINEGAFDVLKTRVNRHNNDKYGLHPAKILLTCNPSKNWLYQTFYLPYKENTLSEDYAFIKATYLDNIYGEKGTEEQLFSIVNESQKQRLMYGNWEYADDPDSLLFYEDLIALRNVDHKRGQAYCGADIARMGDDKSSFAKFDGNYLSNIKTFFKFDTVEVGEKLMNFMTIEFISPENCGVDTVGLGAGTYDYMKKQGKECLEIVSGASPTDTFETYEFRNLRSQMWWQFRTDVKEMNIRIDSSDQELLTDLTSIHYKIVNEKMIQVESKDDVKKRLGRSPDKGDSVVYANSIRAGIINKKKVARMF